MARFKRKKPLDQGIPTGPMADISFLLIIFFMVTTVFVVYRGIPVDLPRAERIDPLLQRRNVVTVWIDQTGQIMVDDLSVDVADVGERRGYETPGESPHRCAGQGRPRHSLPAGFRGH